jgi:hypothetical protein
MQLICPTRQADSFFQKGWTGFSEICLSGKSVCGGVNPEPGFFPSRTAGFT